MSPKVVTLVLNWNRKSLTLACIESLLSLDYPNKDIIVIDNGSTDGSEAAFQSAYPQVPLLQNGDNLGYAEGNNQGIRKALKEGADYVFIVNNDTKFDKSCLAHLIEIMESNSKIGICSPVPYDYEDGSEKEKYLSCVDQESFRPRSLTPSEKDDRDRGSYYEVDWVRGDALLVRADVFEQIEMFDPKFFLLFEEVDFCTRARRAGYSCAVVKNAAFYRMESATLGRTSLLRYRYNARNELLFVSKNCELTLRKKRIMRLLKSFNWEIRDIHLRNFWKTKSLEHIRVIFAIMRGCLDYFLGRFGRLL